MNWLDWKIVVVRTRKEYSRLRVALLFYNIINHHLLVYFGRLQIYLVVELKLLVRVELHNFIFVVKHPLVIVFYFPQNILMYLLSL